MIRSFLSLLLICAAANAFGQHRVIAIGSYNCENFFDTIDDTAKKDEDFTPNGPYHYTEDVFRQKAHNLATVIEKMGTDVTPDGPAVLGLVEVENDNALKLLVAQPEIKGRNYHYCWHPTSDERGISTAMLYNPKYFRVLNSQPLRVPVEQLDYKRPTRDILFVSGVLAGDTIYILVNHWPSKSGGEAASTPGRRLAASTAKHTTDSLLNNNPNSKILIMGDFNDNPTSDGFVKVMKVKSEKEDVALTDIYSPWINMYRKGIGTEIYQGEWNLLDQILVSGSFIKNNNKKWRYYKNEIFNKDFLVHKIGKDKGLPHRSFTISSVWDNGYSDHFPVLLYLVD